MGRTHEGEDGAEEEEMMSEQREGEKARREEAQAHAGEIVAGSGTRGKPRRMPRMVSARLDSELVAELRAVARQRNTTISDLLREGAELVVQDAYADAVTLEVTRSEGVSVAIKRGQSSRVLGHQPRSRKLATTTTRHAAHPAPA
jgi:hypothetical protein